MSKEKHTCDVIRSAVKEHPCVDIPAQIGSKKQTFGDIPEQKVSKEHPCVDIPGQRAAKEQTCDETPDPMSRKETTLS